MDRKEVLRYAGEAVLKDRDEQYGSPEDSFAAIAGLWSAYLDIAIMPVDVANMMILLKVARNINKPKDDNWVDIAGYAACGAEVSEMVRVAD